jgi:hypothetical protein
VFALGRRRWRRRHRGRTPAEATALIGAIFMGLAAGLGPEKSIESLQDGVGSTLGNVGVVPPSASPATSTAGG